MKMRDMNLRHQFARVEIAGHEDAGPTCRSDNAAVTMSVCPIDWQQQRRAAGLLLGAPRAGDIDL